MTRVLVASIAGQRRVAVPGEGGGEAGTPALW
jgi:hypothetical protein